jgi:hypothetical protein
MKFLIGLAAILVMGFLWNGPLGNGARFIGAMEAEAQRQVAATALKGVTVSLAKSPLARRATLSGNADPFQREGLGSQPGLSDLVRGVEGVSAVEWDDDPRTQGAFVLPLLAELLILLTLSYLVGLGLAWLFWGRPRREGFA